MSESYWKGVAYCLVSAIAWGISFPVMGDALRTMDPFNFTTIRYSAAALLFVALLVSKEGMAALQLRGERYILAWLLGSAGFCGYGFFIFHGQRIAGADGAISAAVVIASTPMLTLLVNWVLRGVRPSRVSLACISTSFAGILLVITKGKVNLLIEHGITFESTLFLLLGAISWAVYTIGNSYFPNWSAYRYTAVTTLLGLTTIYGANLALQGMSVISMPSGASLSAVFPHLLYMVLVAGVIAVLCWNLGNRILTPTNGVLFLDVVPLTAFVVAAASGQPADGWQLCGALLSGCALVVNNRYQRGSFAPTQSLRAQSVSERS